MGKKGFTLAEVLITLSILGVIAALTIPSVVKKHEKQQWIVKYKSTYTIISQATKMIMANNGGTLLDAWGAAGDNQSMYDAYVAYLKPSRTCENQANGGDCFSSPYTSMDGGNDEDISSEYALILSNGASLAFDAQNGADAEDDYNKIVIDTNGPGKGPNVLGKDVFEIDVTINSDPVKPAGTGYNEEMINTMCSPALDGLTGLSCGIRILRGDYGEDY